MKWFSMAAGTAVLVGGLAACGGGGGGGGGGGFPLLAPAPATPVALAVNVLVNGNTATADSNGRYAVKPGDTITVTPASGTVDWTSSSAPSGAISLRNPAISNTKWSAQISSSTTATSVFTVSAKPTDPNTLSKDTVFNVSGGDARNGSYKVFAANGTKQTLALNFDTMSYVMTDETGATSSDGIEVDKSETGTYLFRSQRNEAGKAINTRFRINGDTVVGAFQFRVAKVPGSYATQPFVAPRALVTDQNEIDGIYNRLGVNLQATSRASNIRQALIGLHGTVFQLCNDATKAIADCLPPAAPINYTVSPGATPGVWNIVNTADPTDTGAFSIARIGGQNVYLSAGTNPQAPNDDVFRIGLPETATWPVTTSSGGDTDGTWGSANYDATTYQAILARPDTTFRAFGAILGSARTNINGMKKFTDTTPANFVAIQNGVLTVVVGETGGASTGYMQIGLH
ncbi:hypothetical protein [Variovorax sp. EL159]|uniref:hypothetical protein n=1 Tax=Variovorax sp. EL159 TaxID=1566270 RepID=UPI00088183CC|nr:hypothetical protein [Variovorax sp. EL159]SCX44156.1 hypothetical protein SAMN03159363_0730 [Variovorax sp. EL159]